MLVAVVNVSEGRDRSVLDALAEACGDTLLDQHVDPDHNRCVLTLAGPTGDGAERGARNLTRAAAARLDLADHDGVHPRLGVIDVVPFVSLERDRPGRARAVDAAFGFARWCARELELPAFLYDEADPARRGLPSVRRDAFRTRFPDFGPRRAHPRLGAVAVGARPPMVAINVELRSSDLDVARSIARAVRERDGGLPGVRALGFRLATRDRVQVSMNLVDLESTGAETACTAVGTLAADRGIEVEGVELVGLLPESELKRSSSEFLRAARIDPTRTVESRIAAR